MQIRSSAMKLPFSSKTPWLSSNGLKACKPSFVYAETVAHLRAKPEFNLIKKTSDASFEKFMVILDHPDVPMDLKLRIWNIVLFKVIDLISLVKLIKQPKSKYLLDIIKNGLKLSVEFEEASVKLSETKYVQLPVMCFPQYPNQRLQVDLIRVLFKFMKENKLSISSFDLAVYGGSTCYYNPNIVMSPTEFMETSYLSKDSTFDYKDYFGQADSVVHRSCSYLSSMRIHMVESFRIDYSQFEKLTKLTLVVPFLFIEPSINHIIEIMKTVTTLKTLILQYEHVFAANETESIQCCKAFVSAYIKYPTLKVQFSCYSDVIKERKSIHAHSRHLYNDLKPIKYLFESICLGMDPKTMSVSKYFQKINQLTIYSCVEYSGKRLPLLNESLKVLRILGNLSCVPIRLNLSKLPQLQEIQTLYVKIDSDTFEDLPKSVKKFKLIESSIIGQLFVPSTITSLVLSNTFPVINFESSSHGVHLGVVWELELGYQKLLPIIQNSARFINQLSIGSRNASPKCCRIIPSWDKSDNQEVFTFTLEYEEVLQDCLYSHPIHKICSLEIIGGKDLETYGQVLKNVVDVCMSAYKRRGDILRKANSFPEDKERIKKDGVKGVCNLHLIYEKQLRKQLEFLMPETTYRLKAVESTRVAPPVPHYFSSVSPRTI